MPKIPDRWLDYDNCGSVIPQTRFITFKVPLDTHLTRDQHESIHFTPTMLIEHLQYTGHKLGLVIDLTNTNRYYNPAELTSNGVQYRKIFVPGHVIPTQKIIRKFYKAVDEFLKSADEDVLIGVHCTHGVNRTGYVVCRYMVERIGVKPKDALEAYAEARGYPVERENYIEDLHTRSLITIADEESDDDDDEEEDNRDVNPGSVGPHKGYNHHGHNQPPHFNQERIFNNQHHGYNSGPGYGGHSNNSANGYAGPGQYGRFGDRSAYNGEMRGRQPPNRGSPYSRGSRSDSGNWRDNNSYSSGPGGQHGGQYSYQSPLERANSGGYPSNGYNSGANSYTNPRMNGYTRGGRGMNSYNNGRGGNSWGQPARGYSNQNNRFPHHNGAAQQGQGRDNGYKGGKGQHHSKWNEKGHIQD